LIADDAESTASSCDLSSENQCNKYLPGRSSGLFSFLPPSHSIEQWLLAKTLKTYSSGDYSGFSPDSLLIPIISETKYSAKVEILLFLNQSFILRTMNSLVKILFIED